MTSTCLTCTKRAAYSESILIGSSRAAQSAVAKHFWFNEDESTNSILCQTCWYKIHEFHQFFCEIQSIHSKQRLLAIQLLEIQREREVVVAPNPVDKFEIQVIDDDEPEIVKPAENAYSHEPILRVPKQENFEIQVIDDDDDEEEEDIAKVEESAYSHEPDLPEKEEDKFEFKVINANDEANIAKVVENVYSPEPSLHEKEVFNDEQAIDKQDIDTNTVCVIKPCSELSIDELKKLDEYAAKHLDLECSFCPAKYPSFFLLQKHSTRMHRNQSTVVCCGEKFCQNEKFYDHMQNHLQLQFDKPCSSSARLKSFMDISSDLANTGKTAQKTYSEYDISDREDYSDDGSDYEEELRAQLARKKRPRKSAKYAKFKQGKIDKFATMHGPLECSYCPEKYDTIDLLQKHSMKVHRRLTSVLCCKKKFIQKDKFYEHMQNHDKPNQLQCNKCDEWYSSAEALKSHVESMHMREKLFECGMCPQKFSSKTLVEGHRQTCSLWK